MTAPRGVQNRIKKKKKRKDKSASVPSTLKDQPYDACKYADIVATHFYPRLRLRLTVTLPYRLLSLRQDWARAYCYASLNGSLA